MILFMITCSVSRRRFSRASPKEVPPAPRPMRRRGPLAGLASTSHHAAGTALAAASAGSAVTEGVVDGLLVGRQKSVESTLRFAVDGRELAAERSGRCGQLVDRSGIVRFHRGGQRGAIRLQVRLDGLRARV